MMERCETCGGEGGFEAGGPICCGNAEWECGAPGCTGPIDGRYLEQCPACNGTGEYQPHPEATMIEELKALAEKATPGPWDAGGAKFGGSGRIWINATYPCINGLAAKFTVASVVMPDEAEVEYTDGALNDDVASANAALIVALRNNLPAIISALEAVPVMKEALEAMRGYGCPVCSGDCGSANPPVVFCPMQQISQALAALEPKP
jgi:hypothetical protein